MSAPIAAVIAAVVTALSARFLADLTWVWAIVTGVVAAIAVYGAKVALARRSTT